MTGHDFAKLCTAVRDYGNRFGVRHSRCYFRRDCTLGIDLVPAAIPRSFPDASCRAAETVAVAAKTGSASASPARQPTSSGQALKKSSRRRSDSMKSVESSRGNEAWAEAARRGITHSEHRHGFRLLCRVPPTGPGTVRVLNLRYRRPGSYSKPVRSVATAPGSERFQ